MENTLNNGFREFVSKSDGVAEELSKHLEKMFKSDFLKDTQEEIQNKIQDVINIFVHVSDKDYFEILYRESLAKRLMAGEKQADSVLKDAEREVIKFLKKQVGASFTQRLEIMLKDVQQSHEIMSEFKESQQYQHLEVEFQAKVLTKGSWPSVSKEIVKNGQQQSIPMEISQSMDSLTTFYKNKYQSRRIEWSLDHGSAEVHFTVKATTKKYRVTMSTRQTCVLFLFNQMKEISCQTMMDALGMSKNAIEP